jgi:general secretion pathway protein I
VKRRRPHTDYRAPAGGFTLLEVLVALAIVALALGAATRAVGDQVTSVQRVQQRTFAHWVALNQVAALRIEGSWPLPGERRGVERLADIEWRWVARITDTPHRSLRRVEVDVAPARSQAPPLATLVALLPDPR